MSDDTKAAKLLSELGSPSIPPPPASGKLPFSIPFQAPLPEAPREVVKDSAGGDGGNKGSKASGALADVKGKWVILKDKCANVAKTQGIAAIVVFVIVAGIMAAVNPPIVQTKSKNPDEKPKRSVVKILVWASVAALLAVVIPLGIDYAKKKKSVKGAGVSSGAGFIASGSTYKSN